MGAITPPQRADALALFREMVAKTLRTVPINGSHFQAAADIADQVALGIRAGDALHLAVVLSCGATLRTLDRRLMIGADALGSPASLI